MAITAQQIITRVQKKLFDPTGSRWSVTAELLPALNAGRREVVRLFPLENAVTRSMAMAAGVKQTITGMALLNVIANMGVGGATQGTPVRPIARQVLDDLIPGWTTDPPSASVQFFVHEPQHDPRAFYVYPPSDGTTQLRIVQAEAPADISINDPIGLDDVFEEALFNFVVSDALSKSSEEGDPQRAAVYRQAFLAQVETVKTQRQTQQAGREIGCCSRSRHSKG